MSLNAFNAGCNILAYKKNQKSYGMCAAWAQMLDYDVVSILIGSQSLTGLHLAKGDIVGISSLASNQAAIALRFGEFHSDEIDKFHDIKTTLIDTAIFIEEAKVCMKCEVIDLIHFDFSPNDIFAIFKVLSYDELAAKRFLALSDL